MFSIEIELCEVGGLNSFTWNKKRVVIVKRVYERIERMCKISKNL